MPESSDERNSSVERSRFHGGGGKLFRIHIYISQVNHLRLGDNWDEVFRHLQSLYSEVFAWKCGVCEEDFDVAWKKLHEDFVNMKNKGIKGVPVRTTDIPSLAFDFQLELMKVLKHHNFDTELIDPGEDPSQALH